jgi:hypothetical protein
MASDPDSACPPMQRIHSDFHAEVRANCPRCALGGAGSTGPDGDPAAPCLAERLLAFGDDSATRHLD